MSRRIWGSYAANTQVLIRSAYMEFHCTFEDDSTQLSRDFFHSLVPDSFVLKRLSG